jgi:hypothetical protein
VTRRKSHDDGGFTISRFFGIEGSIPPPTAIFPDYPGHSVQAGSSPSVFRTLGVLLRVASFAARRVTLDVTPAAGLYGIAVTGRTSRCLATGFLEEMEETVASGIAI